MFFWYSLARAPVTMPSISSDISFSISFSSSTSFSFMPETFVVDSPLFKERVEIEDYDIIWDDSTSSGVIKPKIVKMYKKY